MDNVAQPIIIALCAATLGWFSNEFSQVLKGYREKRKTLKKTLFFLLETLFVLKKISFRSFKTSVEELIPESIKEVLDNDENGKVILENLDAIVRNILYSRYKPHVLKLEERFAETIEALSEVDPLSAYRLSGEPNVFKAFDSIEQYKDMLQQNPDLGFLAEQIDNLPEQIDPFIIDASMNVIVREIKSISKKIGISTFYKTEKLICEGNTAYPEDTVLVNEFLNNVIGTLDIETTIDNVD